MATGDILSCAVRADGWSVDVTIEGFTTGATYDFGSLDDSPATVTAPMFSVAVVSEGYSAAGVLGTVARTVYGTHVVRKPYPDQASKDETVSGSDLVVRVALSESIYNDDKNGGAGTSGTDPAVTIAAGWATNTGGASETSAAATALACTNNSALDYPKVIAQWAWGHTPAWKRVAAAFDIGCIAYHGHGIACVALSATDAHANAVSGTATTKTAHQMSASSLYYESYDLAVPVTSMTQGDDITLRYVAYPNVGDADSIIDTSTNTTSTDDVRGLTQITCTCDKTGALIDYAVVSTSGNDTTGAKSIILAIAAASPYLTVGKALASGATVIYLRAGILDWLGSTPTAVTQRNYAIEVAPYPGETVELQRQSTWKQYKAKILEYRDFSGASEIKCVHASGYLDGNSVAGAKVFFRGNRFTATTACGNPGTSYRSEGCFWINNTHAAGEDFAGFGARLAYSFTGNNFAATLSSTANKPVNAMVANKFGHSLWTERSTGSASPTQDNTIVAGNYIAAAVLNGARIFSYAVNNAIDGLAFIGNIVETKAITSSTAAVFMGGDSSTYAMNNILLAHNTVIGERCNLFYNDTGTVANVRTNVFVRNNAFRSYNIKTDTFGTPSANRVGNWAQVNGVNYSDNRYDGTVDANFTNDFDGINVAFVAAKDATFGQLGYTDDNSADGDGAGNGDYTPTDVSVLYNHQPRHKYLSFDLYGSPL